MLERRRHGPSISKGLRGHATHSTAIETKSVTIFSNTKLGEIFKFSVYFPSTPSKLKVQVFVLLFLVTLFISPSILSLWELHALSLL